MTDRSFKSLRPFGAVVTWRATWWAWEVVGKYDPSSWGVRWVS